jgi:hypothetical protein
LQKRVTPTTRLPRLRANNVSVILGDREIILCVFSALRFLLTEIGVLSAKKIITISITERMENM